jgi:hypothetical protein
MEVVLSFISFIRLLYKEERGIRRKKSRKEEVGIPLPHPDTPAKDIVIQIDAVLEVKNQQKNLADAHQDGVGHFGPYAEACTSTFIASPCYLSVQC